MLLSSGDDLLHLPFRLVTVLLRLITVSFRLIIVSFRLITVSFPFSYCLSPEAEERGDAAAVGLYNVVRKYNFVASLYMMCDVLPAVSCLSCILQSSLWFRVQLKH